MAENKVSVEITLEEKATLKALNQLSKEIQKTEGKFDDLGKGADKGMSGISDSVSKTGASFKSLVGGVTIANLASQAVMGVAGSIRGFVVDSINAAIEQENAINRLNQALRASGSYSVAASEDFQAFASGLQAVSIHGDEVILNQISLAKSLGATNEQSKKLVEAAANMSATFGGSLESNMEKLGKTLSGTSGKLSKLIPELKDLSAEQLRSAAAADIINSKFSGAASNELNTYSGQLQSMKNAFGDLQEVIGGVFTGSSTVKDGIGILSGLIQEVNQVLLDSAFASNRQKEGFTETASSADQLQREYNKLKVELIDYEQVLLRNKDAGLLDSIFTTDNVPLAKERVKELGIEVARIEAQLKKAKEEVATAKASAPIEQERNGKSDEEINKEAEKLAKIQLLRDDAYAQLQISYVENAAWQAEQDLLSREITTENYQLELDQLRGIEQAKIEAKYAAEEAKAMAIADSHAKQLTLQKIQSDKELAIEKSNVEAKKKIDTQMVALEQQKQAAMAGAALAGLNLMAAVAKDGSKEQFIIQKASAIATAAVAAKVAYMQALAFPPGPPTTIPAASWVAAQGVANVAAIVATSIKGFEKGGIIPGKSMTGDNNIIGINSGEMVLTRQQQTELFKIANGQGDSGSTIEAIKALSSAISNQSINLVVDGRTLATVIKKEVQNGFKLT